MIVFDNYQLELSNLVRCLHKINKFIMEQQNGDGKQTREQLHNSTSIRFRKVALVGSTVQVVPCQPTDKIKTKELVLDIPGNPEPSDETMNIKAIGEDFFRRYKAETGIKHLLKAYDETRKKNSSECMTRIGLDVIKIKSFSTSKSPVKAPKSGVIIHSKRSLKKLQLHQLISTKEALMPVKHKNIRQSNMSRADEADQMQFRHLVQMTSSLTNFSPQKDIQPHIQMYLTSRKMDANRVFKKQRKPEDYLYKRLEGTQKKLKEQQNQIYDKRIKSFLQFLWKNQFAHNIYINLDLKSDDINARPRKLKAYIALGNNGAMVRGLLKRRFWWTLVEERTSDCEFIWTQLKVKEVFRLQKRSQPRKPALKDQLDWDDEPSPRKGKNKFRLTKLVYPSSEQKNSKLMHQEDQRLYKSFWSKHQRERDKDFQFRVEKNPKQLQVMNNEHRGIIHNHLQNNFYLGNKKALFYNLREYYSLIGKNVYHYLPLTFHIRKGLKDPQYTRFLQYHKRRALIIKKQSQLKEEDEIVKLKTRNIWIVKPGQNSNQGKGITVIDQIYELNSIMKQGKTNTGGDQQTERTYIVQMYLDRPLLYYGRKFDIRHYMIITNFFGVMRSYWYDEGYIRTSSFDFDIDNFCPQIHLTNDSVQKQYPEYGRYQPYNKLSYQQFQRYLDTVHGNKRYNFRQQLIPKMKQMATDASKSVFTTISPHNQMNNFQILGLDFMVDRNFQPWLIEINTNPCLDSSSHLLNRIVPYMVEQSFKLTIDLAYPPPTHYPNTAKHFAPLVQLQNFKYQLIFDSQHQGAALTKLYRRYIQPYLVNQIGQLQDDEEFKDEGKECKLDDYT